MKSPTTSLVIFTLLAHASAQIFTVLPGSGDQQTCQSEKRAFREAFEDCDNKPQMPDIVDCICSDRVSDIIGIALNCLVSADGTLKETAQEGFDQYSQNCRSNGKEVEQQVIDF
ncbi:hypothetical protein VNI00_019336 [Paramarasmius palmivorus]|uniref:Extracellular membrane protein CFEM domain-containing protein n=1 Tax=Paramarasmius palmivorus TaxID=297713 RepID=A0AAW0AN78_9AGAR